MKLELPFFSGIYSTVEENPTRVFLWHLSLQALLLSLLQLRPQYHDSVPNGLPSPLYDNHQAAYSHRNSFSLALPTF